MNRIILLLFILFPAADLSAQTLQKPTGGNWSKGTSDKFVGTVWVEYFKSDTTHDFISARVLFEPNARSHWHKHKGVQIIFAVEGEGYYLEKGKPIRILKKGEVVVIDPETIHSHGACDKMFVQSVVMNKSSQPNATIWLEAVSEDEMRKR